MHISRVQIRNFRNFKNIDVPVAKSSVLVGGTRALRGTACPPQSPDSILLL